jgi:hypothetical protein
LNYFSNAPLEVKLIKFVENRVKKKGVSDKAGRLGIDRYLKLLLPLVLEKDEIDIWLNKHLPTQSSKSENQKIDSNIVIRRCIDLNELRNKVVHKGEVPSEKIAIIERGIVAIELFIDFIRDTDSQSLNSK